MPRVSGKKTGRAKVSSVEHRGATGDRTRSRRTSTVLVAHGSSSGLPGKTLTSRRNGLATRSYVAPNLGPRSRPSNATRCLSILRGWSRWSSRRTRYVCEIAARFRVKALRSARQGGVQPYVHAVVHCCFCKAADPQGFPRAGTRRSPADTRGWLDRLLPSMLQTSQSLGDNSTR